jgi:hypothetical protein
MEFIMSALLTPPYVVPAVLVLIGVLSWAFRVYG